VSAELILRQYAEYLAGPHSETFAYWIENQFDDWLSVRRAEKPDAESRAQTLQLARKILAEEDQPEDPSHD
jgi:hypothetical protein